jgi:hypothetical protein
MLILSFACVCVLFVLVVANLQTGSQTGSQTNLQTDLQTFISVFGLLINFMPKVLCITNFNDIFAPRL